MSQVDLGKFACDSCQRQYPWKPEYAGRKVKCKCGAVITAPAEPPKPKAADDDDLLGGLYDLAEQEQAAAKNHATVETGLRCPSCQADMLPGQTVCTSCNFNLKTGLKARTQKATAATGAAAGGASNPMLAYAGANRRSQAQTRADNANAIGGSEMKELYVPGALVLLGLIAQTFQYGFDAGAWRGLTYALPSLGLSVLFNVVLSFIGIAIVAKMFDLGFGAPGPAITKLVAICLLPPAIAQIIGNFVGSDSAFVRHMVPAILILPIAEIMFVYLFDLALDEAMYTSIVIYLVSDWAVMILLSVILTGGGMGFGGGGPSPSNALVKADQAAAEALTRPNSTEANSWLADSVNRMYSGETHDSSQKLVTSFYEAGAKKCTTLSSSGEGYALVIELPKKAGAREKVFALIHQREAADKVPQAEQTEDEGQKFYTIEFGH